MSISELLAQYGADYLRALVVTLELTAISFSCALVIGVLITVMRVSPIKPMQMAGDFYVQVFRNIPGVALLIFLVYAMPYLNFVWSYFACVAIACTLIPSAFCSEYLMAGMNTIPPGEIEAARSLGMNFSKIIKNLVLPQAVRASLLQLTNLLVATLLTTSLASQVPLMPTDLTGIVNYINSRSVGGMAAFAISAALYCAIAVLLGQFGNWLDKKVRVMR